MPSPRRHSRIDSLSTSMAPGRVKLLRQASAIVRLGAGSANGRTLSMSCPGKTGNRGFGTTVIPIPTPPSVAWFPASCLPACAEWVSVELRERTHSDRLRAPDRENNARHPVTGPLPAPAYRPGTVSVCWGVVWQQHYKRFLVQHFSENTGHRIGNDMMIASSLPSFGRSLRTAV